MGLAVGLGGFLGIVAAIATLVLVPETKRKPLEEATGEDRSFKEFEEVEK